MAPGRHADPPPREAPPEPAHPLVWRRAGAPVTASITSSGPTCPATHADVHAASTPERSRATSARLTSAPEAAPRSPRLTSRVVPDYRDVLASASRRQPAVPQVPAECDLVVETADGRFCGAVVAVGRAVDAGEKRDTVTLEDRHGKRRVFALLPAAFLLDGRPVTLVRPAAPPAGPAARVKTASG